MIRYLQLFLLTAICLLLVNSCSKDKPIYETNNLNGNKISAFGHAGMGIGFKYPIDTYESFEPCLRIGSDGTEIDIQMTKDGILVAYHDSKLEEGTLCSGTINDKLWSEIWGCHQTSPYSSKINLISVNDLFNRLQNDGYNLQNFVFTFDCKLFTSASNNNAFLNQYANAIIKTINDFELENNLLIESGDTAFLHMLQNKRDGLKLFIYPNNFDEGFQIAKAMNLFGIIMHTDYISSEQIKQAHDNGFRVTLWGMNSEQENVDAILKSPDFLQSDKIIHLLKVFGKYKNNINDN